MSATQFPITLVPGTIPPGLCFATDQERYNFFISQTTAFLANGFTGINIGNSVPGVEQRGIPWFRLNNDGSPDKIYYFYAGQWLAPNPESASSQRRIIWTGQLDGLSGLAGYDGGDGTAAATPTATTGPMWMPDPAFAFAVPMGAGTNTVVYDGNPATTLPIAGNLGEERHTLSIPEIPAHTHGYGSFDAAVAGATAGSDIGNRVIQTVPTGGGMSHQNLPPVVGVTFAMRSVRQFYRAT